MAVSAATVYTGQSGGRGDNSGAAAILDNYGDPLTYVQDLIAKQAVVKAEEAKQKKLAEKQWQQLAIDTPDAWSLDSPFIEDDIKAYSDQLIDMKVSGLDPTDIYGEAGKKARELERSIERRAKASKENELFDKEVQGALNRDTAGKYDKAYAADWLKRYRDPKLTPEERADMRRDGSPLKPFVSIKNIALSTMPKPSQNGREIYVDQADHESVVLGYLAERPEEFEALKEREDETLGEVAKRVASVGQDLAGRRRTPTPVGRASSTGSASTKEMDVNPSYDESVSVDDKGRINSVTFTYKTATPKTVQLVDPSGNGLNAKVLQVKKTPRNDAWVIVAETEIIQGGRTIKETVEFPIDSKTGGVGYQNYQTLSGLIGRDFQTVLGDQSEGAAKAAPSNKAETPAERIARIKREQNK